MFYFEIQQAPSELMLVQKKIYPERLAGSQVSLKGLSEFQNKKI